jgi:hypothetical protein
MSTHANRVKMTVTSVASSGTGDITLNAASTGFRSFATAYGANATVDILITEGTAWEIARNCTYTHSGTTVNRGTLENSSTGSAVAFTSAAVVSVIATASFGNAVDNTLGAWGALNGENSITGTATAVIGRLNVCSGTSANYTVTLPAVSGNSGKYIGFRMAAGLTKLVTLDGDGTETIDGATTRVMYAKETALLYCDGTTWTKMAGKTLPLAGAITGTQTNTVACTNGTPGKAPVTGTSYDTSGLMCDSATNKRINVVRAGLYHLAASVFYESIANANLVKYLQVSVNGTADGTMYADNPALSAGSNTRLRLTRPRVFAVNDYVEIYGLHYGASNEPVSLLRSELIEVPAW